MSAANEMKAQVDFDCIEPDCGVEIQFNLLDLTGQAGSVQCRKCHRLYQFDRQFLSKLEKLRILILAVRDAEEILGDCNVAVTTPAGEVKIPYRLLLTRLNTLISVDLNGTKLDFNFRVEPLNKMSFR